MSEWSTPKIEELERPAPLIEPHVDLRDWQYMPLLIWRLRDSEFMAKATREEIGCALLLWCAAWREKPAGSLPNDDNLLSTCCKFAPGVRQKSRWLKVKNMSLWNFVLCSDGRFYHPVICEQAKKSWELKVKQRDRTAAATAARWDKPIRNGLRDVYVTDSAQNSVTFSVTESKRREEKIRKKVYSTKNFVQRALSGKKVHSSKSAVQGTISKKPEFEKEVFEKFWEAYGHKLQRKRAEEAFAKAATKASIETIVAAVKTYHEKRPSWQQIALAASWLNGERWTDESPHKPDKLGKPDGSSIPMFWIDRGTPEWDAWEAWYRAEKGKPPPVDFNRKGGGPDGGWMFPAEFPPVATRPGK